MSDVMLYGVLRMRYEMAMGSEMSRYQFYQRAQEAANRLEAAEAELAAIKAQPATTEASDELRAAAAAVVARWDTPKWKDEKPTADFIARLRRALEGVPSAQGEDSARLDALYYAMCIKPFIAAICTKEQWLKSIDEQIDRARASAETGGVKS
jgi:hypothetical protein